MDEAGTKFKIKWPYPIRYEEETEENSDILVVGGGVAGCMAAVTAARSGFSVILLEKAATIRSGAGGPGVDHWQFVTDTPCCPLSAEELTGALIENTGGYTSGISRYIQAREGYDTLCEFEQMGAKVRDYSDEFKGALFRDEETKLLFANDIKNKYTIRVWGSKFKPILYRQCKKLGVKIFDRVMGTSLLTEGGKPGARVVGATGLDVRTGGFYIFKAKATILTNSRPQRNWIFSSELRGISSFRPAHCVGNGHAMAWRAGAELAMMEKSVAPGAINSSFSYPYFGTGNPYNTWFPCNMIDAEGKKIPWVDRDGNILKTMEERYFPSPGQKMILAGCGSGTIGVPPLYKYRGPKTIPDLEERIRNGEFKLPLYADLPSMPAPHRNAIFGLMVGEEGKTRIPILEVYTNAGFDPDKHLLQSYIMMRGETFEKSRIPQERVFGENGNSGGILVDWDLKSTLDGLYAAGDTLFGTEGYSHAAVTGRYAARCAGKYVRAVLDPAVNRDQVEMEKARVYEPIKRSEGVEWKELNAGICRVMQNYCGDPKNDELLRIGLIALQEIREEEEWQSCAADPHKLMRTLDVLDILTNSEIIMHACMERKSSDPHLGFNRLDYPEIAPPEWHKWLTIRQDRGTIITRLLPIDFWLQPPFRPTYEENYMAHVAVEKRISEIMSK
ncbi:MAG: FAD-binding protein [Deltaproteobacteria bacterium]|nr:FAD-binding protein [Deltaproteobacteria bacterium]